MNLNQQVASGEWSAKHKRNAMSYHINAKERYKVIDKEAMFGYDLAWTPNRMNGQLMWIRLILNDQICISLRLIETFNN